MSVASVEEQSEAQVSFDEYCLFEVCGMAGRYVFVVYVGPHGVAMPVKLVFSVADAASLDRLRALNLSLQQLLLAALGLFMMRPGPKTGAMFEHAIAHRFEEQPDGLEIDERLAAMINDGSVCFGWMSMTEHVISTADASVVARTPYDRSTAYAPMTRAIALAHGVFGDDDIARFVYESRNHWVLTHLALYRALRDEELRTALDRVRAPEGTRRVGAAKQRKKDMPAGLNVISRSANEYSGDVITFDPKTGKLVAGHAQLTDTAAFAYAEKPARGSALLAHYNDAVQHGKIKRFARTQQEPAPKPLPRPGRHGRRASADDAQSRKRKRPAPSPIEEEESEASDAVVYESEGDDSISEIQVSYESEHQVAATNETEQSEHQAAEAEQSEHQAAVAEAEHSDGLVRESEAATGTSSEDGDEQSAVASAESSSSSTSSAPSTKRRAVKMADFSAKMQTIVPALSFETVQAPDRMSSPSFFAEPTFGSPDWGCDAAFGSLGRVLPPTETNLYALDTIDPSVMSEPDYLNEFGLQ